MAMLITWNEVFVTGSIGRELAAIPEKSGLSRKIARAEASIAWAQCMAGCIPPGKFGHGIFALSDWSGLSVLDLQPEKLSQVNAKAD